MPTITVSAPRRRVMREMPWRERETNESMTSSAVTSTMIPRERWRVTWAITSSRSCRTSVSVSAAWMDAIRNGPCLRIGTAISASVREIGGRGGGGRAGGQRGRLWGGGGGVGWGGGGVAGGGGGGGGGAPPPPG